MSDLGRRQRTAPPIDRWHYRRLESGGGYDVASPRTLAPGLENTVTRFDGALFDTKIQRDRGPYYPRPMYMPPGDGWVNWTAAGPIRPELGMRCATLRTMQGNTMSRYPVIDSPSTGMHTMGPAGTQRTADRYVQTPQMLAARYDRLRPGQYSGQSYSQTTRIQGA